MQVFDQHHGSEHGQSIAPTANVSGDQTGLGIDLGRGSLVGHVTLCVAGQTADLVVDVQEADDNVAGDYATTHAFTISANEGDMGTDGYARDRSHKLQFTRSGRWCRVKVVVGSNTSIRLAAVVESQLIGAGNMVAG